MVSFPYMTKVQFFGGLLAIALVIAIVWRVWPIKEDVFTVYEHGYYSKNLYDHAYTKAGEIEGISAKSAIVAHHLLVADKVAEVFEAIGSKDVQTVILLSPNHFSQGKEEAQVGAVGFTTPYGMVAPDVEMIQKLLDGYIPLSLENETLQGEHGISTLTPFIKRSFPNAKLVPIILHESMPSEEAIRFGQVIAETVDARTIVIASIDMSHNLPLDYQLFHDGVTKAVIAGGVRHAEGVDLEIDANAVLRTLLSYNRKERTEAFTLTHHDSSLNMGKTELAIDNTSHILGYFLEGLPDTRGISSALVTNDQLLLKEFDDQPFYERDRRAFGQHMTMTREDFFASGLTCEGVEKTTGTVGLLFHGTECIISVIH